VGAPADDPEAVEARKAGYDIDAPDVRRLSAPAGVRGGTTAEQ
jgi:hypothetical protein